MNAALSDSMFSKFNKAALQECLAFCQRFKMFDFSTVYSLALALIRHYRGDCTVSDALLPMLKLRQRWYISLCSNEPDYSIYDDDCYISDLWACWVVYSRKYLLAIQNAKALPEQRSIAERLGAVKKVVDLGCGFGYTSAVLKELFPSAEIFGTNLEGTAQYKIASELGNQRNFRVIPDSVQAGNSVDLIFASEFFEHIQDPIRLLIKIIKECQPRAFLVANAFGAQSVGHFDHYQHNGKRIANSQIGKLFNQTLRRWGYAPVKTKLWNNRPAYWSCAA